jgi:hypothetical protein
MSTVESIPFLVEIAKWLSCHFLRIGIVPSACPVEDFRSTRHLFYPRSSRFSLSDLNYFLVNSRFLVLSG